MGTQQSRSGHGRQGSQQHSQQSDHRPQQDRDLQRNKQSDRGQQHPSGEPGQQSQSGGPGGQQGQGASSKREASHGEPSSGQQSTGVGPVAKAPGGTASGQRLQGVSYGGEPGKPQQAQGGVTLDRQHNEVQQSTLGGGRDFEHKLENEGREQNRRQDTRRQQMSGQGVSGGQQSRGASGEVDALRGGNQYGEGNYAGTRQYDKATKEYAESGRVEQAARAAAPKSDAEAREMEAAEAEGKRHAKGADPALTRGAPTQKTPRPGHEEE